MKWVLLFWVCVSCGPMALDGFETKEECLEAIQKDYSKGHTLVQCVLNNLYEEKK